MNMSKGGIQLLTLSDVQAFAQLVIQAGLARVGDTESALMCKIEFGMEIGLAPLQAIQSVAIRNNTPSLYGDAVPALVMASGLCESWQEETTSSPDQGVVATWTSKRKGVDGVKVVRFSEAMAKKAKLWGKPGPWTDYPARMLQMRARSWGCRDLYADVLRGLGVAEEVADIPDEHTTAAPAVKQLPSIADLMPMEPEPELPAREPGEE